MEEKTVHQIIREHLLKDISPDEYAENGNIIVPVVGFDDEFQYK